MTDISEKKYKGVVVGCGDIGALFEAEPDRPKPASHAGSLSVNPKTALVGLVDVDEAKRLAAQKLFPDVPVYATLADCLTNEVPDIVIVTTPPASHASLIEESVAADVRMILCEKPLAESSEDIARIERVLVGRETVLVLNYQRRFFEQFELLRRDIAAGNLGTIEQVTLYYSNGVLNNGGHSIDAVNFLLNDPIVSVWAEENVKNKIAPNGDSNVDALLETSSGVRIVMQSFDQSHWGINDLRLYGTKGAACITTYGYSVERLVPAPGFFAKVPTLTSEGSTYTPQSMVAGALGHLIDCFEGGKTPLSGIATGKETTRVLEAVLASAEKKERITITHI